LKDFLEKRVPSLFTIHTGPARKLGINFTMLCLLPTWRLLQPQSKEIQLLLVLAANMSIVQMIEGVWA
jgi:hypothetical protein